MADWLREIELQHIYGMTPTEASLFSAKEGGESVSSIAEAHSITAQTVSNILCKARAKFDMEARPMEIVIVRVPYNAPNYTLHNNAIEVIVNFVAQALGLTVDVGKNTIRIRGLDNSKPGNMTWMNNNVFRYVSVIGTRNREEVITRVRMLLEQYEKCEDKEDKIGYSILFKYLDDWYVKYDTF